MRQEQISLPIFSSRRVFCGPSKLQNGATTGSLGPEQVEHRRNISEEKALAMHDGSDEVDMASLDLNPFVDGLLDMAAHSPNLGIRFEATAIMGLLVAHTEPVSERAQYVSSHVPFPLYFQEFGAKLGGLCPSSFTVYSALLLQIWVFVVVWKIGFSAQRECWGECWGGSPTTSDPLGAPSLTL